jgi:hypothetical protein
MNDSQMMQDSCHPLGSTNSDAPANGRALSCRPQNMNECTHRAADKNDSFSCDGIGVAARPNGQLECLVRAQTPPDWFQSWYVRELMIMHGVRFSEKEPDDKKELTLKRPKGTHGMNIRQWFVNIGRGMKFWVHK